MDLSILRWQDPKPGVPRPERRRRVRHKLHTPVYASFAGPRSSMVLDLSELLDVHEDGFAVQTVEKLEVNRPVNLCLDLVETKSYVHGTGHVVWSDGEGRAAVRFSNLPDSARRLLKEWLFVNLLVACANHAARTQQLAQPAPEPAPPPDQPAVPDLSGLLSALDVVRREIRAVGTDYDAALHLVTLRALTFTGASGAALALLTGDEMICRARAGDPAPPLGARVDVQQGLSGECVRSARLISCRDTETDPRVDRELCRELRMGSILAAPVVSDFRVVGLLEAFSPRAQAFTSAQETALDRLAYLVPTQSPSSAPQASAVAEALPSSSPSVLPTRSTPKAPPETETEGQEPLRGVPVRRSHLLLLVLAASLMALAIGYASAPALQKLWRTKAPTAAIETTAAKDSSPAQANRAAAARVAEAKTPGDLRRLAEQGDKDAQWALGVRYHNGDGVPQSDTQAAQWFLRAAEQGHVLAQATMGAYYWAGRGVPQDLSKAYFWSVLARAGNDEASKYRVAVLTSRMSRAQVMAAQQQAEAWIQQHASTAKPRAN